MFCIYNLYYTHYSNKKSFCQYSPFVFVYFYQFAQNSTQFTDQYKAILRYWSLFVTYLLFICFLYIAQHSKSRPFKNIFYHMGMRVFLNYGIKKRRRKRRFRYQYLKFNQPKRLFRHCLPLLKRDCLPEGCPRYKAAQSCPRYCARYTCAWDARRRSCCSLFGR